MDSVRWERLAAILICLTFGIAAGYFVLRVLLPPMVPFLIALVVFVLVRPLAKRFQKRFGGSVKVWSAGLFLLFLILLSAGLWFGIRKLWEEGSDLLSRLSERRESGSEESSDLLSSSELFLETLHLPSPLKIALTRVVTSLEEDLPRLMGRLLAKLSDLAPGILITIPAGFYFCFDGERMFRAAKAWLPTKLQYRCSRIGKRFFELLFRYLRAYLQLFLMTVGELFVGFRILGVRYALLSAIGIAILDLLPVFGVGTVLLPWGIVSLLQNQPFLGFGLLILYAAVFLLRQLAEPRLIGKTLGLSPLLVLLFAYVGFRLFGIVGMISAPFAALTVKSVMLTVCGTMGSANGILTKENADSAKNR